MESCGAVFGAYFTEPWHSEHRPFPDSRPYWGTSDTFVFTCAPKFTCYPWMGHEQAARGEQVTAPGLFMSVDEKRLAVGGGGPSGHALEIDDDLNRGWSDISLAFCNPPLHGNTGGNGGSFTVNSVEMWAFGNDELEL